MNDSPSRPAADAEDRRTTGAEERPAPESAVERKRLLAKVFGDVLPERAGDERSEGWGDRERSDDDWLRSQIPPHHGT